MKTSYKHLFGPVPSRRLGRSLGVDLTPFKTCSFDCVFCQLGRTTRKTVARKEYVAIAGVTAELADWLEAGGTADYITLSGSGEPTLNSGFGSVIQFVRASTRIPVALLTNGSLFRDPEVRAQAALANVVKVSLSAWDQASLARINRPHRDIRFETLMEGLLAFRRAFKGQLWLEVFMVPGLNTDPGHVERIAALVRGIAADKVQLNTAVRPPCEAFVTALPARALASLGCLFDPPATVIAEFEGGLSADSLASGDTILDILKRRPCTLDQICRVTGLHRNEALKFLGRLMRDGRIQIRRRGRAAYYYGTKGISIR